MRLLLLATKLACRGPHSNKYFRPTAAPLDYPLVSLAGYLRFWAVGFLVVTSYVAFFQAEVRKVSRMPSLRNSYSAQDPVSRADEPDMDIRRVYSIMIEICKQRRASEPRLCQMSLLSSDVQTYNPSSSFIS